MLAHVFAAPFAMMRKPGLFIAAWLTVFIQGGISLVLLDSIVPLTDPSAAMTYVFSMNGIIGILAILANLTLTTFIYGWIASHVGKTTPHTIGEIIPSSFLLALFVLVGVTAFFVVNAFIAYLAGLGGIIQLFAFALFGIMVVVSLFAITKFVFTPSLLGKGITLKDALSQSWNMSTGNFFSVIILILVLLIISTFVLSIPELFPFTIENEWASLAFFSLFAGISTWFSATTLGLSIHAEKKEFTSIPQRKHMPK
ncbi:MAG: hypothetical protein V1776_01360 [Candidatus Diapherotrites archaeon]